MPIDKTIPGGAYKLPNGSWIDANGRPIRAPREEDLPKAEESDLDQAPAPSVLPPTLTVANDDFSRPSDLVDEDDKPKVSRTVRKKKE